jgi:hypothetical protein
MASYYEPLIFIRLDPPAIDKKGVLFISDIGGKVYALQTGSKGLDPLAQWPKYRYNNQNGGRPWLP